LLEETKHCNIRMQKKPTNTQNDTFYQQRQEYKTTLILVLIRMKNPLSPHLFILTIEPFKDPKVKLLWVHEQTFKKTFMNLWI